jgi:hypothetical protein
MTDITPRMPNSPWDAASSTRQAATVSRSRWVGEYAGIENVIAGGDSSTAIKGETVSLAAKSGDEIDSARAARRCGPDFTLTSVTKIAALGHGVRS